MNERTRRACGTGRNSIYFLEPWKCRNPAYTNQVLRHFSYYCTAYVQTLQPSPIQGRPQSEKKVAEIDMDNSSQTFENQPQLVI
jgi:hypothetical protein